MSSNSLYGDTELNSIIAGQNITLTGTKSDPVINSTGGSGGVILNPSTNINILTLGGISTILLKNNVNINTIVASSFTNSTYNRVLWSCPQISQEGFINGTRLYLEDMLPLQNFKLLKMRIEKVIMANGTNGGQYMAVYATAAPIGSSVTTVDNMSFFKVSNSLQTNYIGNVDNGGNNQGVIYHDFPYTYATFPSTGLALYTQSSAGGSNITWTCYLEGVL